MQVIVVPDDDIAAGLLRPSIPSGILKMLDQTNVLMSHDSLRMYVRATMWQNMVASLALTNRPHLGGF